MATVEELIIKLTADNSDLKRKFAESEKGVSSMGGVVSKLGSMIAGAFTVSAVLNFTKAAVQLTAKFQTYNAVLKNTLGSQDKATASMKLIAQFASETPFSVDQLTASFVKLANQGFIPSKEEMRKLGDVASSTGKGFDQLVEGMLDATMGEFERLKEFGIKAQSNGDKVIFTFKGVKTQVDNNADSIRAYILGLGELNGVMGSMSAISETLEGKISNMGDAWDQFLLSFGKTVSPGVSAGLSDVSAWLTEINNSSGFFNKLMASINPVHYMIGKTNTQLKAEADQLAETRKEWQQYDIKLNAQAWLKTEAGIKAVADAMPKATAAFYENHKSVVATDNAIKGATKSLDSWVQEYERMLELQKFDVPQFIKGVTTSGADMPSMQGKTNAIVPLNSPNALKGRQGIDKDVKYEANQYGKRLEQLKEFLAQGKISYTEYAEQVKSINQEMNTAMFEQGQNALYNMASLFAEHTVAYKVFASALALMDTYKAANASYAALAGIPIVGPALGAAAAATAIAAGLGNVGKIAGAFANGGIVGGGSYSGDQLTARVNSGEMILNGNQQRELFAMANGMGGRSQVEVVGYISGDVIRLANKRGEYMYNRRG